MPAGYTPPGTKIEFLPWEWAAERLERSRNYWVCTTRTDGRPHAAPVWGLWLDQAVIFSTDPNSLKARNIDAQPSITVHLESGDEAVIVEGTAERIQLNQEIDDAYHAKYKIRLSTFPSPAAVYKITPAKVMAWREQDFVNSATRWKFE
ncbi:MAG TPA: pyridoxamine 5'-phosphate oxidase family protein [Terriglobales bacterium]|nr:pyridoxamine 5'-phosphate oxidase family protein [Terriglobales bacterium]